MKKNLYRCLYFILSKCQFFCGVIWILTNSFVCRKRVKVDEWIWIFKIKKKKKVVSLYKLKQVGSYSIYFYNIIGQAVEIKKTTEIQILLPFFSFLVRVHSESSGHVSGLLSSLLSPDLAQIGDRKRVQSKLVSLMRHQGERHVPALKSDFSL